MDELCFSSVSVINKTIKSIHISLFCFFFTSCRDWPAVWRSGGRPVFEFLCQTLFFICFCCSFTKLLLSQHPELLSAESVRKSVRRHPRLWQSVAPRQQRYDPWMLHLIAFPSLSSASSHPQWAGLRREEKDDERGTERTCFREIRRPFLSNIIWGNIRHSWIICLRSFDASELIFDKTVGFSV